MRTTPSRSLNPWRTSAMSFSFTGTLPSTLISSSRISSSVLNWLIVRTRKRWLPSSMRPPEAFTFSFFRRVMTSLMSIPSRASFCWSIETSISSSRPPPTLTAATPATGSMRFFKSSSAKRAKLLELRFTGLALHREPEPDDRIGRWIEAQQQRLLRFQRQLQRVELVAHLKARHVHVGAPSELEHDVGLAGARDRMHLAHVLDDADGLLDRLADQVLDFERCGAFVLGAHGQRRIGQVRQQVDLEAEQSDQAEQHQGQRQHADRDTPARGQLGQIHDALPPVGVPASACGVSPSTCTSVPSRTALRPIVMTRSPSFRPSRISTRSPSA